MECYTHVWQYLLFNDIFVNELLRISFVEGYLYVRRNHLYIYYIMEYGMNLYTYVRYGNKTIYYVNMFYNNETLIIIMILLIMINVSLLMKHFK